MTSVNIAEIKRDHGSPRKMHAALTFQQLAVFREREC
jgi:hypothetical protein